MRLTQGISALVPLATTCNTLQANQTQDSTQWLVATQLMLEQMVIHRLRALLETTVQLVPLRKRPSLLVSSQLLRA